MEPAVILVDTGAFRAKFDRGDKHRRRALPVWRSLERHGTVLVTTNHIFSETATFLNRTCGGAAAADFGRRLLGSGLAIDLVRIEAADEFRALEIMEDLDLESVSFTDGTSFAIMRRRGITTAFAFDGDFAAAGFGVIPPRA